MELHDDAPTIVFGTNIEDTNEYVPPFYLSLNIQDMILHNVMLELGACHNLISKDVIQSLGLDITRPYKDIFSFDSRKVRCLGLIKDLLVTLTQIPAKSIVMDVVVDDVPPKFGMLLFRSWALKLKGTSQMDM